MIVRYVANETNKQTDERGDENIPLKYCRCYKNNEYFFLSMSLLFLKLGIVVAKVDYWHHTTRCRSVN